MPIYEYQCLACDHQLEAIQKTSDPVLKKCPACNKAKLKKLVSAAGFQLKGTGWYVTDFKDKPKASESGKKEDKGAPNKDQKPEKAVAKQDNKTD